MAEYPSLVSLFTRVILPDNLGLLTGNSLDEFLKALRYKNLNAHVSASGDSAFYGFDMVLDLGGPSPLGLEIPGTKDKNGESLRLTLTGLSEGFPMTLSYQWNILRYLDDFLYSSFPGDAQGYFDLLMRICGLDQKTLLTQAIYFAHDPVPQFPVDFFVSSFGGQLTLPNTGNTEDDIRNISEQIVDNGLEDRLIELITLNERYLGLGSVSPEEQFQRVQSFFSESLGFFNEDSIIQLLLPRFSASIDRLELALLFPDSILSPVQPPAPSKLTFNVGSIQYTTENGLDFQEINEVRLTSPSRLLKTGFVINFTGAKLDLSRTTNIPEAIADGRPSDFIGVYVQNLEVTFPTIFRNETGNGDATFTAAAENLLIGTGGVSGTIRLETGLELKLGSFELTLQEFFVQFQQNSIIGGGATGKLMLPFGSGAPEEIGIDLTFREDGDFSIVAKETDPNNPLVLSIKDSQNQDIVAFEVQQIELGQQGDRFYAATAGKLTITPGDLLDEPVVVDIRRLVIWDNGELEFQGGEITIPASFNIKLGPVDFSVTKLRFGSYSRKHNGADRKYYFVGFDGGLNIGDGAVDVQGKGVRFYFTYDNGPFDSFVEIAGIGISLKLPKSDPQLVLKGFLILQSGGYAGSVTFGMPKIGLQGSATMFLNPDYPYFLIDASLKLSVPIPLGTTGLGIYGFRGLFGNNFVTTREESESWWTFYKGLPYEGLRPVTDLNQIDIDSENFGKFKPKKGGLMIGAGVQVGTVKDSGKTVSAKVFLLLTLPDGILIIGQASILADPATLDGPDPPFTVLLAFSRTSIEVAIGIDYNLPQGGSGDILKLTGALEMAYFFNNSSGWYVNIGRDLPEDKRISARLFTLFDVYGFLMISALGIKAGSGIDWMKELRFGPVHVSLQAFLRARGSLSFEPVQISGSIEVGGSAKVGVRWFGVTISVSALLMATAPKPFIISGGFKVSVGTPWPLPDINVKVDLTWRLDEGKRSDGLPIVQEKPNQDDPGTASQAVGVHIQSGTTFKIKYLGGSKEGFKPKDGEFVVPLDSFIDIELSQSVCPKGITNIGGQFAGVLNRTLIPPDQGIGGQVKHEFEVTSVKIYYKDRNLESGNWQPYSVYEQMLTVMNGIRNYSDGHPGANKNGVKNFKAESNDKQTLTELKDGYWQLTEPNRLNKLRLLSQNVFSYTTNAYPGSISLEGMDFDESSIFCWEDEVKKICIDWEDIELHTKYPINQLFDYKGVSMKINSDPPEVISNDLAKLSKGLQLKQVQSFELLFDEPVEDLEIVLVCDGVVVASYFTLGMEKDEHSGVEKPVYVKVRDETQDGAVIIDNVLIFKPPVSVSRITISSYSADQLYLDRDSLNLGDVKGQKEKGDVFIDGNDLSLQHFDGGLDDLKIFNRALSDEEIQIAMNVTTSQYTKTHVNPMPPNPSGLVSWWGFDQISGKDIVSHHDATISGLPPLSTVRPLAVPTLPDPNTRMDYSNYTAFLSDAVQFTAQADFYIQVPKAKELAMRSSSYTLMAWVNPGRETYYHPKDGPNHLVTLGAFTVFCIGKDTGYNLALKTFGTSFQVVFYEVSSGKKINIASKKYYLILQGTGDVFGLPVLTGWQHIAVTVDRVNGFIKLYVNGILEETWNAPEVKLSNADLILKRICYTTETMKQYSTTIPSQQQHKDEVLQMTKAMEKYVQPLWRPNCLYAVEIKGRDLVDKKEHTYCYGFQTRGPLGHYHQAIEQTLMDAVRAEQNRNNVFDEQKIVAAQDAAKLDFYARSPLVNLTHYLDFDKSYPNADGNLAHAKPVHYKVPDIRLFFNQPYMYAMFVDWEGGLDTELIIRAYGADKTAEGYKTDGVITPDQGVWEINDLNDLKEQKQDEALLQQLNDYIKNNSPCAGDPDCHCVTTDGRFGKYSLNLAYRLPSLQPNKLYTLAVSSSYEHKNKVEEFEVLRYVFRTSRYANFREQVYSYLLGDDKVALLPLDLTPPADVPEMLNKGAQLLAGNLNDPGLTAQFADPFDRLINGILKLPPLEPPVCTEVNVVRLKDSIWGRIGLLIRSPEPFFDPRIPLKKLAELNAFEFVRDKYPTLKMGTLFSKDRSSIWISILFFDDLLIMEEGKYFASFTNIVFNGEDYVQDSEAGAKATLTIEILN